MRRTAACIFCTISTAFAGEGLKSQRTMISKPRLHDMIHLLVKSFYFLATAGDAS